MLEQWRNTDCLDCSVIWLSCFVLVFNIAIFAMVIWIGVFAMVILIIIQGCLFLYAFRETIPCFKVFLGFWFRFGVKPAIHSGNPLWNDQVFMTDGMAKFFGRYSFWKHVFLKGWQHNFRITMWQKSSSWNFMDHRSPRKASDKIVTSMQNKVMPYGW